MPSPLLHDDGRPDAPAPAAPPSPESNRGAPTRARRWTFRAAVALMLTGALMLGWVAWQLWGTTFLAERHRRDDVAEIERQWDAGRDAQVDGLGGARAVVRIPRFGADHAVPVWDGTGDDVLSRGFGHFDGTAQAGEEGNFALAGHRITQGEPLRRMPELEIGDEVVVETRTATHVYELVTPGDGLEVSFTDTWVIDPRPTNPDADGPTPPVEAGDRLLTLTTCAELFHTDGRLVAFARLVASAPRADAT